MMHRDRARLLRWAATTRRRHRAVGGVLRAAAPLLPRPPAPVAPIFILGAPRSGTTMLFQLLDSSRSLASIGYGSQFLLEMFRPDAIRPGRSHAAGPEDVSAAERRVLTWAIDRIAATDPYLDKFPRMVLRVPYLQALYPDARFVHIVRDGRAVVSSLLTGWRTAGKFGHGTPLPQPVRIDGYDGAVWRFLLPPGWEVYTSGCTLAEVCAFQWVESNRAVLDAPGSEAFHRVSYERLVADPVATTTDLLAALGLPGDPDVLEHAGALDQRVTRTAVTPPRPDKWRDENPAEVESILARIEPMMRRLGYEP
jgi:hypothetical protein